MRSAAGARDRALAFVEAFGDAFSAWSAAALVAGRPVRECPLPDGVSQRPDGSFAAPGSPGAEPALGALLRVIGALDDVRALHLPVIERACAHLAATQADDGSWGPAGASEDERIFFTGMLGGHFGKTRFARASMLAGAGDYIAERFSPERDGGWLRGEDPAPEARVAHTLDALAALARFA